LALFQRYASLPLSRRWIVDVVHFGLKSHVVGISIDLNLSPLAAARRTRQPLIAWSAIVTKAIASMGREWPQLRRAYLPFPWPHFYEHPHCVAALLVEREWRGSKAVFFDHIRDPESMSVAEIDAVLRQLKTVPVESVGGFRRLIRMTRLPRPLRRLIWSVALYGWGRWRSHYLGTFSINAMPARSTRAAQSTTPITVSFLHGPIDGNGTMPMDVFFDHRVIDGMEIHRFLRDLQTTLNGEIAAELRRLAETAE
jgi:hypothetical protein